MDDYLSKPVPMAQLGTILARWLPSAPTAAPSPAAAPDARVLPALDPTALAKLIGDDSELLAEFRRDYLTSARASANEVRTASAQGEWAKAGAVAHKLKSSSRAVGALALGDCCERLELAAKAGDAEAVRALQPGFEAALEAVIAGLGGEAGSSATATRAAATGVLLVDDEPFYLEMLQRQLSMLDRELALGNAHAEQARQSLQAAQTQVGAALDDFSQRILDNGLDAAVSVNHPNQVRQEIGRLNDAVVQPPLRNAAQALQPVQRWMGELKTELAGPLHAARALAKQARRLRPLLLVVDDDELLRKLLSRILGAAHYDVETAASATDAMTVLRKRRPDLILMDVQMPDIDGVELTRRLKASEAYAGIPVIMLTGQSEKEVIVDSLGAGAIDFVVKPFDRDTLLKKVAHHLGE